MQRSPAAYVFSCPLAAGIRWVSAKSLAASVACGTVLGKQECATTTPGCTANSALPLGVQMQLCSYLLRVDIHA